MWCSNFTRYISFAALRIVRSVYYLLGTSTTRLLITLFSEIRSLSFSNILLSVELARTEVGNSKLYCVYSHFMVKEYFELFPPFVYKNTVTWNFLIFIRRLQLTYLCTLEGTLYYLTIIVHDALEATLYIETEGVRERDWCNTTKKQGKWMIDSIDSIRTSWVGFNFQMIVVLLFFSTAWPIWIKRMSCEQLWYPKTKKTLFICAQRLFFIFRNYVNQLEACTFCVMEWWRGESRGMGNTKTILADRIWFLRSISDIHHHFYFFLLSKQWVIPGVCFWFLCSKKRTQSTLQTATTESVENDRQWVNPEVRESLPVYRFLPTLCCVLYLHQKRGTKMTENSYHCSIAQCAIDFQECTFVWNEKHVPRWKIRSSH